MSPKIKSIVKKFIASSLSLVNTFANLLKLSKVEYKVSGTTLSVEGDNDKLKVLDLMKRVGFESEDERGSYELFSKNGYGGIVKACYDEGTTYFYFSAGLLKRTDISAMMTFNTSVLKVIAKAVPITDVNIERIDDMIEYFQISFDEKVQCKLAVESLANVSWLEKLSPQLFYSEKDKFYVSVWRDKLYIDGEPRYE